MESESLALKGCEYDLSGYKCFFWPCYSERVQQQDTTTATPSPMIDISAILLDLLFLFWAAEVVGPVGPPWEDCVRPIGKEAEMAACGWYFDAAAAVELCDG